MDPPSPEGARWQEQITNTNSPNADKPENQDLVIRSWSLVFRISLAFGILEFVVLPPPRRLFSFAERRHRPLIWAARETFRESRLCLSCVSADGPQPCAGRTCPH